VTQRARRANPYPFTWEVPAAACMTAALVLVCGVHLGRAVANWFAGAGWALPARADLFTSLPGVLGGDPAAGLTGLDGSGAGTTLLWVSVAVTELTLLAAMAVVLAVGLNRWGPGRLKGMATRAQAEQMLGRTRLRTVRAVVRPDLYGTPPHAPSARRSTGKTR